MQEEAPGTLGLGVEQQATTPDLVTGLRRPADYVAQQSGAEAPPLVVDGYTEAGE